MNHLKKFEDIDYSKYREVEPGIWRSKHSLKQEELEKNIKEYSTEMYNILKGILSSDEVPLEDIKNLLNKIER